MNNYDNLSELNNLDPLDLAFLFLDGEANETEKRILFEELSKDENLQKEFGEAIEMKYAGIEESKDLTPPIGLTNAIYGTLGIGAANMVGNIAQNYGGNYFSGLVNSASTFISPIYMMITSFILGGMISYFAFDGGNNNNKNISQNTKKIIPITQMSETKNVSNIDTLKVNNIKQNNNIEEQKLSNQNVINELNLVQVFKYRRNKINPEIMEIDTLYYTQEKVNMLREEQKKLRKNEITQNIYNGNITASKIDSTNSTIIVINDDINGKYNFNNYKNNNKYNMPILTPNENIDQKIQIITPIETNDKMNLLLKEVIKPEVVIPEMVIPELVIPEVVIPNVETEKIILTQNNIQDYELKVITINSISYFQNKPNYTDNNTNFNNIQFTGLYKISENQKVGLSIGNEDYPRYVKSGEEFVLTNDLTYFGGVYNYNFLDINFVGNIKSNINLLLGFASESLVNKSGIEVNWKPDSKLSLNFGIETLLNMANYNNAYEYTGKLNFYYGVSYNF